MQLLSTLNSLDNVADGSTRKLLKTATSSGSGNAVTAVSISGDTLTYTKGESFTKASILPNDAGEIKTKYRIAQKGYTGGNTTYWYYPICTLPADNSSNYASVIISGRIGGWVNDNMSYISALCWNRSGDGISALDISGGATSMNNIWSRCDIVLYRDTTSKQTSIYLKCNGYFTFDLDFEFFQSGIAITYNGSYISATPSGTLGAQASTSNKRMEIINSQAYVAGNQLISSTDYATSTKGGVVKSGGYGLNVNSDGTINCLSKTYQEYQALGNTSFIGKGTLENVIAGKGLTSTSVSQTLTSGTEVGSITINGIETKLYAPATGSVNTSLASPQQTYYLTGVQTTISGQGNLYNSYLSSTYTGIKYVTSTSQEGGSLYVDDREVVTGLYYEIS